MKKYLNKLKEALIVNVVVLCGALICVLMMILMSDLPQIQADYISLDKISDLLQEANEIIFILLFGLCFFSGINIYLVITLKKEIEKEHNNMDSFMQNIDIK